MTKPNKQRNSEPLAPEKPAVPQREEYGKGFTFPQEQTAKLRKKEKNQPQSERTAWN